MAHYDKFRPTAIQRSLHNIAEFFQRVFCGVVITDAHSWLTQYLARTNEVLLL